MIQTNVFLEVNRDLVKLFGGLLPVLPRMGERARFPYKNGYLTTVVVSITHNFESQDVNMVVKILDESPSANAGVFPAQYSN